MASCTDTDPSYIYWGSDGTTQDITFHEYVSNQWLFSDPNNAMDLTLMGSPSSNQQFQFKQIENTDYAKYLRYGDKVYLVQNIQTVPFYATASPNVYKMEPSPTNCLGSGYPQFDYVILESQTAADGAGVRFDDPIAVNGYPCSNCTGGSPNYWGGASPGSPIAWVCSPLYSYAIHDSAKGIPTQQYYECYGTDCIYAPSPSGPSCSSCLSTCGQSGYPLPGNSNIYKPFPDVASLPLAGCSGATAKQTYTLYSGAVEHLWLLFILGETTDSVTSTVPAKVKYPKYPSSNGFLVFSFNIFDISDGSAMVFAPGTSGPTVTWGANSKWQSWATGGSPKTITVKISMDGLSFTMNGKTQTVSFVDIGYASGLYCNLYAAHGIAANDPYLAVAGSTSLGLRRQATTKPLAPDWWWYGLLLTGVVAIAMILLVTFCAQ